MNDEFSNNTEAQESKSVNEQLYGEGSSQQAPGSTPPPVPNQPGGAPPPGYAPQQPYQNMVPPEEKKSVNGFAIAGLVCGIVSVVCCCFWPTFIVGVAGIVLSVMGLKNSPPNQKTMAMFGLILSIVGTVFGIIMLILSIVGNNSFNYLENYQPGDSIDFDDIWGN